MKQLHKLGFTLAELLAVIIIISILSALGVGAYKKSVEQSRFSEGLAAASAVVEAVNRAHFDDQIEGRSVEKHAYATLDVDLRGSCASNTNFCRATQYFNVVIGDNDVVYAYRGTSSQYKYFIEIHPNFGSSKDRLFCVGADEDGQTFCESMGYVSCSELRCTK